MIYKQLLWCWILILGVWVGAWGQVSVRGKVSIRETGEALQSVSVVARSLVGDGGIVGFAHSDENGFYVIDDLGADVFELRFSAMGYEVERHSFSGLSQDDRIIWDVTMAVTSKKMEAVIIEVQKPIVQRGDTVIFDAAAFAKGNERVLADLLEHIPGIRVDDQGAVWVGYQEIKKIMVEGEDFFGSNYQTLSTGMPAYPIEKVELLNRFTEHKLKQGLEESDQKALNIVLKSGYKVKWFGNATLGAEPVRAGKYEIAADLMDVEGKFKTYLNMDLNSLGKSRRASMVQLMDTESAVVSPFSAAETMFSADSGPQMQRGDRFVEGADRKLSKSLIFAPSAKLKLNLMLFYDDDRDDWQMELHELLNATDSVLIRKESYFNRRHNRMGLTNLNMQFEPAEGHMFKSKTLGHLNSFQGYSVITSGEGDANWQASNKRHGYEQQFEYAWRVNADQFLQIDARIMESESPQWLVYGVRANSLHLKQDSVSQSGYYGLRFRGWNAHYLRNTTNGGQLELKIGSQRHHEVLKVDSAAENHQVDRDYFEVEHNRKWDRFSISGRLLGKHLYGELSSEEKGFDRWTLDAGLKSSIAFDDTHRLTGSYTYASSEPMLLDLHQSMLLAGYRSRRKGTAHYNHTSTSTWVINHQAGGWSSDFLVNTLFLAVLYHQQIGMDTWIYQDFSVSEKIWVKGSYYISIQSTMDYYLKPISSNLKLELSTNQSRLISALNGSDPGPSNLTSYRIGLDLKSGFNGVFNFHVGGHGNVAIFRGKSDTESRNYFGLCFVDFALNLNERIQSGINFEWCFSNIMDHYTGKPYLLDFNFRYLVIKNKLSFGAVGKNLLGASAFVESWEDERGILTSNYKFAGRMLLLSMNFRI